MTAHFKLNTAAHALLMPRAVSMLPRAEQTPAQLIAQIQAAFEQFKARNDGRIDELSGNFQKVIDDLNAKIASGNLNGTIGGSTFIPPDPDYSRVFAGWARGGRDEHQLKDMNLSGERGVVQNAMSAGTDSAGGYLAPIEWDRTILKALVAISPMRRICDVQVTTVRAFNKVWNAGSIGTGWVGETATRPETSTPTLSSIPFGHGEIYANPFVTQQLLDDADFDVSNWLAEEVSAEFDTQEGIAFIAGNGTNKPYGLLTYVTGAANAAVHPGGAILVGQTAAGTTAVTADELLALVFTLAAGYRQNATWLMNSLTASKIMALKDTTGRYLWQQSLQAGQPSILLGYPVEIDENMPNMISGALPIAFGDFRRGYLINDRFGTRVLRDPYTNKPYVGFYTTKRVGGGLKDPKAFRVLKMA